MKNIQIAEEFIVDPEERGYLDFDGGEQIERESIKSQIKKMLHDYTLMTVGE